MEHLAIIMDGNGRWAKARGLPRTEGHRAGGETVRRVLQYCRNAGIRYLTLYAFSVENWKRPKEEVDALMNLLVAYLAGEESMLHQNQVRLRIMGRREDLPERAQAALKHVEEATAHYDRQLILCLSYGGRTEMVTAAQRLARRVAAGELSPEAIDEATFAEQLYLPDVPDPDLIVRTSGEMRLSNFLLWQASYAELYVTPVLWPDFSEADFKAALDAFEQRNRRYGGL
ncbi:MAG: di-trans,poly-cis-decaprenylcistransferase [Kiritimatiellae bacterium]|nr:di-trans,poly-cis-decaprenylcistransferase [Kiritimatiellia bacterium]MBR5588019.1 di-trans,poly-cis-decaprenylcistransferase [Kiritimatiellia bacterium]